MRSLNRRWRRLLATLMASATIGGIGAAVVVSAPAAQAAFPGTNGPIVFVHGTTGDLIKIDPVSGIATTVCGACGEPGQRPGVSADGKTAAFDNRTATVISEISINGGAITAVTGTGPGDEDPVFTPDGSKLVFENFILAPPAPPVPNGLFTVSATGGGRTAIFGSPLTARLPDVSPDGSRIAFLDPAGCPGIPPAATLKTIPIGGGTVSQVSTTCGVLETYVSWSPDGSKIAVSALPGGGIALLSAVGNNQAPVVLPNSLATDQAPSFSPDGSEIVADATPAFNPVVFASSGAPGRTTPTTAFGMNFFGNWWAVSTTTSGSTTTTTPCFGTLSGAAFKGSHAKPKKALAGVTVSAAPTPTGTALTATTNAAGQYSFTVPCGTYNKTALGPANNSRTCHFGSGKGPLTAVATVTNGSTDTENLFCKGR